MKEKIDTVIFDFCGTLVKMRPPELLAKKRLILELSRNAKLGIITGARKAESKNILSKLGIESYFDFVVTKDDSPYSKPDKRVLREIKGKITPQKTIYIGDAKSDFLFAKNTGMKFCYVGKKEYGLYQNQDVNQVINFIVKNLLE